MTPAPNPNGSTHTQVNLAAVFPIPGGCGTAGSPCTFNGSSPVSTGAPLAGPVAPMSVKITAPVGYYHFICLIHPQMQGWLAVVPSGFHVTSAAELATKVHAQATADREAGWDAEAAASHAAVHTNMDGSRTWTLTAGTSSPDGHVVILEMLPRKVTIAKGDHVRWISRATNEPHTVTFPTELHSDMVAMCENGATDTPATPTKFPPTGPTDFTCKPGPNPPPPDEIEFGGGNGVTHITSTATVADSGIIASSKELAGFSLPATAASSTVGRELRRGGTGTYHYLCQIHQGMEGTIIVH